MQKKLTRRFQTTADLIHWETARHFKKKRVDLPPEHAKSLVTLACFPDDLDCSHVDLDSHLEREMQLFSNFFCYEPDLALEVLCFARKRYAHHNRGEARKKAQRVRRFLLSTANLFQGRNAEGEPELTCFLSRLLPSAKMFHCEFPEQELARRRIKTIPVASLQDKEIAAFLFGPKCPAADLETVKEVRHSLSIKS